jgi:hypothetical protein
VFPTQETRQINDVHMWLQQGDRNTYLARVPNL